MADVQASPRNASRPTLPLEIATLVADPVAHADGRIYDALEWCRNNEPLGIAHPKGFDPFWVVSKQADLRAIAMRPDYFHNTDLVTLQEQAAISRMKELLGGREFPVRSIVQMDPPDHAKYRAVAADFFHAKNVDQLTGTIWKIAAKFIDRMASFDGECDFAREVAFVYPLHVVMSVLGVPQEDEPYILKLTQEFFGTTDPDLAREGQDTGGGAAGGEGLIAVANDFNAYFDVLLAKRRQEPRNDLVSIIANAKIDGAPMPEHESRGYCIVAATAGHDTTGAVTAAGAEALAKIPGMIDQIRGDDNQIKAFIEETARMNMPSKITMRRVVQDIDLCNRQFRTGDWIAMGWASGNFDEDVVPDAKSFRIDRKPNKHITFGNGPHVCIGQHLARLEMRILFSELTNRVASMELAGEPACMQSLLVSGIKSLPIRFKMR